MLEHKRRVVVEVVRPSLAIDPFFWIVFIISCIGSFGIAVPFFNIEVGPVYPCSV